MLPITVVFLVLAVWRLTTWAQRAGWGPRHMLALASGALGFFICFWDVAFELTGGSPATAIVALIYLVVLIFLARRVRAPRLVGYASHEQSADPHGPVFPLNP